MQKKKKKKKNPTKQTNKQTNKKHQPWQDQKPHKHLIYLLKIPW